MKIEWTDIEKDAVMTCYVAVKEELGARDPEYARALDESTHETESHGSNCITSRYKALESFFNGYDNPSQPAHYIGPHWPARAVVCLIGIYCRREYRTRLVVDHWTSDLWAAARKAYSTALDRALTEAFSAGGANG